MKSGATRNQVFLPKTLNMLFEPKQIRSTLTRGSARGRASVVYNRNQESTVERKSARSGSDAEDGAGSVLKSATSKSKRDVRASSIPGVSIQLATEEVVEREEVGPGPTRTNESVQFR